MCTVHYVECFVHVSELSGRAPLRKRRKPERQMADDVIIVNVKSSVAGFKHATVRAVTLSSDR